jgi:hypothetical protein
MIDEEITTSMNVDILARLKVGAGLKYIPRVER